MEYEISECIAHYKRIYCLVKLCFICACVLSINVKCILQMGLCLEKFKKHFLDIEMYTSCWLLYSEKIYSPTIAIILQWGLMESIPTFPPLPSSATSSICYNSKQIFPPYFHHMATSFQLWKHRGHPTLYQVNPNSCWPLACSLACHIFSESSVSVLPPVLFSEATLICVGRKCSSWLPQLSILQVLPMFHFRLKLSLPKGHGTSPSYKSTAFLTQ